jgi:hypothetical protein
VSVLADKAVGHELVLIALPFWVFWSSDDPAATINVLFSAIVNSTKPDFIIWTGDDAADDVWAQSKGQVHIPRCLLCVAASSLFRFVRLWSWE